MGVVERNYAFMLINNILWILYATQFGLMCWVCTLARHEFDRTGIIIYAIILNCKSANVGKPNSARGQPSLEVPPGIDGPDGEENSNRSSSYNLNYVVMESLLRKNLDKDCVRNEVNDFSIQLQQHRVAFTACDFFEMNNSLLSGVSTRLLIFYIYIILYIRYQVSRLSRKLYNVDIERGNLFSVCRSDNYLFNNPRSVLSTRQSGHSLQGMKGGFKGDL